MLIRDAINEIISFFDVLREYADLTPNKALYEEARKTIILMLAPVVPHICEEMWELTGQEGFNSSATWPIYDSQYINESIERQWLAFGKCQRRYQKHSTFTEKGNLGRNQINYCR